MTLKQRLLSNMFLRNMLADLGNRSAYSTRQKAFIPYFQYQIGPYQPDYYLYFPTEPYTRRYTNEIFNKLYEYNGYDAVRYLEFHYSAFTQEKEEFLRFLRYEIAEKLKLNIRNRYRIKLQAALDWVAEKQQEQQSLGEKSLRQQIEQEVRTSFMGPSVNGVDTEGMIRSLSDQLASRIEIIMAGAEEKIELLTGSFLTGNIQLNNHHHLDKLLQLYILIFNIQAPGKNAKGEQLFKRCSFTDLATLLHLHFEAFKNKKLNTIQVDIRKSNENLNWKDPKLVKLSEALSNFFY